MWLDIASLADLGGGGEDSESGSLSHGTSEVAIGFFKNSGTEPLRLLLEGGSYGPR